MRFFYVQSYRFAFYLSLKQKTNNITKETALRKFSFVVLMASDIFMSNFAEKTVINFANVTLNFLKIMLLVFMLIFLTKFAFDFCLVSSKFLSDCQGFSYALDKRLIFQGYKAFFVFRPEMWR